MKKNAMKLVILACALALSAALMACANQAPAVDVPTEAVETETEAAVDSSVEETKTSNTEGAVEVEKATEDVKADEAEDASEPTSNEAAGASTEEKATKEAEVGLYESDEQCLSCHGGTYEALAETTSEYGLSNPHNSIHGGYNSCVNCHLRDKEITDNKCDNCHSWPHNPETGMGVALAEAA